ncbi:tetrahydrofolylpolyglutamate synthase [Rhizoctonia solani]|uniref:Tetrahydrofolylpolyglutamate synthase n=1 Tax=Rhizoctonia solani TaxID=456999 RepID=A0A8H8NPV4_9AGAM|nr:tetrahydrofolylpolyglutamate synthase [Rhizoctonia solani]QRW16410.1 tetrahydrofolylpolyglutamate synthase [Rhizoctonia solani]
MSNDATFGAFGTIDPLDLDDLDDRSPSPSLRYRPPSIPMSHLLRCHAESHSERSGTPKKEYSMGRPQSVTPPITHDSLANHICELSIRENDMMSGQFLRGRSNSPRQSVKSGSRSRKSPNLLERSLNLLPVVRE